LSFLLGSHKSAKVAKEFLRKKGGKDTEFVDSKGPRFPPGKECRGVEVEGEYI
jgi:hypothetical protein